MYVFITIDNMYTLAALQKCNCNFFFVFVSVSLSEELDAGS